MLNICSGLIELQKPILKADKWHKKYVNCNTNECDKLILFETFLREKAYRNATIQTNQAFYDDSDMNSNYFLVVVYDQFSNTPLLSARVFSDNSLISKTMRGDFDTDPKLKFNGIDLSLTGKLYLSDRLSANLHSSIYRYNRETIFNLLYKTVLGLVGTSQLLLMVRKTDQNKQLNKYLKLGFVQLGCVVHKGKDHEVIYYDFQK